MEFQLLIAFLKLFLLFLERENLPKSDEGIEQGDVAEEVPGQETINNVNHQSFCTVFYGFQFEIMPLSMEFQIRGTQFFLIFRMITKRSSK